MLFGVCIYARKWRVLEDEQLKVQMLSNKIQPQKENERLQINMHAWNDLKKQNPDFWAQVAKSTFTKILMANHLCVERQ